LLVGSELKQLLAYKELQVYLKIVNLHFRTDYNVILPQPACKVKYFVKPVVKEDTSL